MSSTSSSQRKPRRHWRTFLRAVRANDAATALDCLAADEVMEWLIVGKPERSDRNDREFGSDAFGGVRIIENLSRWMGGAEVVALFQAIHPNVHPWWEAARAADRRGVARHDGQVVREAGAVWASVWNWTVREAAKNRRRAVVQAMLSAFPDVEVGVLCDADDGWQGWDRWGEIVLDWIEDVEHYRAERVVAHATRLLWDAVAKGRRLEGRNEVIGRLILAGADVAEAERMEHAAVVKAAAGCGVVLGSVQALVREAAGGRLGFDKEWRPVRFTDEQARMIRNEADRSALIRSIADDAILTAPVPAPRLL